MERKQMLSHEVNKNKMTLNKQIRIGLSTIEFYEEEESKTNEELKSALTRIYDVSNKIARNAEKRGIDTSDWFYNSKQIKLMQQNEENLFI